MKKGEITEGLKFLFYAIIGVIIILATFMGGNAIIEAFYSSKDCSVDSNYLNFVSNFVNGFLNEIYTEEENFVVELEKECAIIGFSKEKSKDLTVRPKQCEGRSCLCLCKIELLYEEPSLPELAALSPRVSEIDCVDNIICNEVDADRLIGDYSDTQKEVFILGGEAVEVFVKGEKKDITIMRVEDDDLVESEEETENLVVERADISYDGKAEFNEKYSLDNQRLVVDHARKIGVPEKLALALALHESGKFEHFIDGDRNKGVLNPAGSSDFGLMQINKDAHEYCFVDSVNILGTGNICVDSLACEGVNAEQLNCNIEAGLRLLKKNYDRCEKEDGILYKCINTRYMGWQCALRYYNGLGCINLEYVDEVTKKIKEFEA